MANAQQAAQQQWKEFLESTPAYVECRFENLARDVAPTGVVVWGFRSPRIDSTAKWTMASASLTQVLKLFGTP